MRREPLEKIIAVLKQLPLTLEEGFLSVGEKLAAIARVSNDISRNSTRLFELMAGTSLELASGELHQVLGLHPDQQGKLRSLHDKATGMRAMELMLGEAVRQTRDLQRHTSMLRHLSIQTRITSRSTAVGSEEFETVADSIKELGALVNQQTAEVISSLHGLNAGIRKSLLEKASASVQKERLAGCIRHEIDSSISTLKGLHDLCADHSRTISDGSSRMARSIGQVVALIQYQDITRQKMEHTRSALEEVVRGGVGRDAEVVGICELQLLQLRNTHRELSDAMAAIGTTLQALSTGSETMELHVRQLAGAAGRLEENSNLGQVQRNLAAALSFFEEDLEVEERTFNLLESILGTVGDIAPLIDGIGVIGEEIKLIAFNAIIKAYRLSDDGIGMQVIANAIKSESEVIRTQTAAISEQFLNTKAKAYELQGAVEDDRAANLAAHRHMRSLLDGRLQDVRGRNQEISEMARLVNGSVKELKGLVELSLTCFAGDHQRVLSDHVIPALEQAIAELRKEVAGNGQDGVFRLDRLRTAYTMKNERDLHDQFVSKERGKVLTFQRQAPTPAGEDVDGEHFGANVELF